MFYFNRIVFPRLGQAHPASPSGGEGDFSGCCFGCPFRHVLPFSGEDGNVWWAFCSPAVRWSTSSPWMLTFPPSPASLQARGVNIQFLTRLCPGLSYSGDKADQLCTSLTREQKPLGAKPTHPSPGKEELGLLTVTFAVPSWPDLCTPRRQFGRKRHEPGGVKRKRQLLPKAALSVSAARTVLPFL